MGAFLDFLFWVVLGTFLIYAVSVYNLLNQLREAVRNADQTFNASVRRKQTLVAQVIELAKSVAVNEHHTHFTLADAITQAAKELAASNHPTLILADLAVRFPTLKHDQLFANAQGSATQIERQIDSSLSSRNKIAENYNVVLKSFPTSIVAYFLNFSAFDYRSDEIANYVEASNLARSNTRKDLEDRLDQAMNR